MYQYQVLRRAKRPRYVNHKEPGHYVALCDRCGLTYNDENIVEEWTGLMVCTWCLDPKPESVDSGDYVDYEKDFPENPRPIKGE